MINQDFQLLIEQYMLTESTINYPFVRLVGILKRLGGYQLSRFIFGDKPIENVGKRFIATSIYKNSDKDKTKPIATIVAVFKDNTTNGDFVGVALLMKTTNSTLKTNIEKALSTAKIQLNANNSQTINDYRVIWFGDDIEKQDLQRLIQRYDRVLSGKEDAEDKTLKEATMITTQAVGNTPAQIRLRGGTTQDVNKLISGLNSLRSTLFIQQVQDNGTCALFTFGRQNRPTVELMIQRRNGNIAMGPRAFGVNAIAVVDGNGETIKGSAVSILQITDKTGIYAYSGANSRLRSIVRANNTGVRSNVVGGVEITEASVPEIIDWLRSIVTMNSGIQIATSWSKFIASQTKQLNQ